MSETSIPTEAVLPAEVKVSDQGRTNALSEESVVRKIEVVNNKGEREILYYKRLSEGAFTTVV